MNRLLTVCLFIILLSAASLSNAQTFSFGIDDDTIMYTNGDTQYGFTGVLDNLQAETRNLVITLTPIDTPDPGRYYSICTYQGCYPPDSGQRVIVEDYESLQHDTGMIFDIYNLGYNGEGVPDVVPISGDYHMRVTVHSEADPTEIIGYDLALLFGTSITEPRLVATPLSAELLSNYPNPFNPSTTINFIVSKPGAVEVNAFNLLGQNVATLVNSPFMSSGSYSATWNATNAHGLPLPSGIYLIELNNAGLHAVHRVVLLK